MDQPYSPWADWLDKFHTSSEFIQALWLIVVPLTVLGLTWLLMCGIHDILRLLRRRGDEIDGLYQDYLARDVIDMPGRTRGEINRESPPPELVEREQAISGMLGRKV